VFKGYLNETVEKNTSLMGMSLFERIRPDKDA